MNATEELRRMLDGFGIEYDVRDGQTVKNTYWNVGDMRFGYCETVYEDGQTHTSLFMYNGEECTPERAIAVTLGESHPYEQRITGDGSDWGEIMADAFDSLMSSASESCTPDEMRALESHIAATLGGEINGDTSDGYHTFNELYHHRAVLFSMVVASHREIAWKSKLHHDGTMYDGMFIVGIDTPWGQASYHYDIDPYWDMFDCEERESAPEWDGHTPDDAIERIGKLAALGGGKLTAEQVRECAERAYLEGYSDGSVNRGAHIEETDWQAIADELNATLGKVGFQGRFQGSKVDFQGSRVGSKVCDGKLTAEQVWKAIYDHSIYATFDGVKYYAEGIATQLIADELNMAIGGEDSSADDALALLDKIRDANRISYDDYSQLFDAIAERR